MFNLYRMERDLTQQMTKAQVPGLAAVVLAEGDIVYARGFGITDVRNALQPASITPETVFRLGSSTASLTGTLVMHLVDLGVLDLDRPVIEYVPWLTFDGHTQAKHITLRMLLTHTSGLPDEPITIYAPQGPGKADSLEENIRTRICQLKLINEPGKRWLYSSAGICLAGYIVEAVSGRDFVDVMKGELFHPLDMCRTTFDPLVAMTYSLAQGHCVEPDGYVQVERRFADDVACYPVAFAYTSALDLASFAGMHVNEGTLNGTTVLSAESVSEMHSRQVDVTTEPDLGYGLTFFVKQWDGFDLVTQHGQLGAFRSQLHMIPERKAAAVTLYNGGVETFDLVIDRLVERLFQALL